MGHYCSMSAVAWRCQSTSMAPRLPAWQRSSARFGPLAICVNLPTIKMLLSRALIATGKWQRLLRHRHATAAAHRALQYPASQQQRHLAQGRRRPAVPSAAAAELDQPSSTASSSAAAARFVELGVDQRLLVRGQTAMHAACERCGRAGCGAAGLLLWARPSFPHHCLLRAPLQAILPQHGIDQPNDVQRAAIPAILQGSNVAVQCYTGSGKTLAYLLPILSLAMQRSQTEWEATTRRTRGEAGGVQAMVVVPSRELAMQIVRVAQGLLPESARRAVQQAIGGAAVWRQKEALRLHKPLLVVGTPGRLAELSRDGTLPLHK